MKNKYIDSGRRQQKLKTTAQIFKAAHALMRKGEVLSLDKIAKEANISRATIYRYYSNIDVLTSELPLSIQDENPENLVQKHSELSLSEQVLKIQEHYLDFTFSNEATFRKYLGSLLNSESSSGKRAGRRIIALEKILSTKNPDLSKKEKKHLINIASLFMGIEALILTKDVCNLNDKEAKESLKWGLEKLLNSTVKIH